MPHVEEVNKIIVIVFNPAAAELCGEPGGADPGVGDCRRVHRARLLGPAVRPAGPAQHQHRTAVWTRRALQIRGGRRHRP